MSLDKAIEHGKEKRKPYRGGKTVDYTCRNHGSCGWCECNRKYANQKREQISKSKIIDYIMRMNND